MLTNINLKATFVSTPKQFFNYPDLLFPATGYSIKTEKH